MHNRFIVAERHGGRRGDGEAGAARHAAAAHVVAAVALGPRPLLVNAVVVDGAAGGRTACERGAAGSACCCRHGHRGRLIAHLLLLLVLL